MWKFKILCNLRLFSAAILFMWVITLYVHVLHYLVLLLGASHG